MLVQYIETKEIYNFITQYNDTIYLEADDHSIYIFEKSFFEEKFTEFKIETSNDN